MTQFGLLCALACVVVVASKHHSEKTTHLAAKSGRQNKAFRHGKTLAIPQWVGKTYEQSSNLNEGFIEKYFKDGAGNWLTKAQMSDAVGETIKKGLYRSKAATALDNAGADADAMSEFEINRREQDADTLISTLQKNGRLKMDCENLILDGKRDVYELNEHFSDQYFKKDCNWLTKAEMYGAVGLEPQVPARLYRSMANSDNESYHRGQDAANLIEALQKAGRLDENFVLVNNTE